MTSDTIKASSPPRARRLRPLATTCVLVIALGAGLVAGLNAHKAMDFAQLSSTAWAKFADLRAWIETSRMRWSGVTDQNREPQSSTTTKRVSEFEGIGVKLDQYRASSEAAIEGLRGTLNQMVSSIESTQRQLGAEFEALRTRLDRGDRNEPGPVITKLQELNERLDRIERSAAVAALAKVPQPAVANSNMPGTTTAAPSPDLAAATAARSEAKPLATTQTKKIPNWIVREVINGTAILQGPGGVIRVSSGDLVPGVGRVQSIAKKGGRWIVATNKGVISAR